MKTTHQQQSGVALLIALLIVSMVTVVAVTMVSRQQLDIRRTSNLLQTDQAYLLGISGEYWGHSQLLRNILIDKKSGRIDSLDEDWNKPLAQTEVENGNIASELHDAQSRFNLNNLYLEKKSPAKDEDRFNRQFAFFRRLLQSLDIDEKVADAVTDWIDLDINTRFPDGAEDLEYSNTEIPTRTANGLMSSPTELLLIKGIDIEAYQKLLPLVTTLPKFTPLNINTASIELLQSLVDQSDESIAQSLIEERDEEPFKEKKVFLDRLKALLGDNAQSVDSVEPDISVFSHFYLSTTKVELGKARMQLDSLLYVDNDGITKTLIRSRGGL